MREYQQKHSYPHGTLFPGYYCHLISCLVVLLLRSIMELNDKRIAVKKLQVDSAGAKRQDLGGER
jgi:hypothetical protein